MALASIKLTNIMKQKFNIKAASETALRDELAAIREFIKIITVKGY